MRVAVATTIAAICLAGCGNKERRAERDFAECRLRVASILPAEVAHPSESFGDLLDSCMIAKGYMTEFSATPLPCHTSRSEECYEPPK
jgi:hypothetical protein